MDTLKAYNHVNWLISRKIFEINQNRPWVDDSNYQQWQDDASMIIEVLRELEHEILITREIFPKVRKYEILEQSDRDERSFSLKEIETWEIIENVDILTSWDIDWNEFTKEEELEIQKECIWDWIRHNWCECHFHKWLRMFEWEIIEGITSPATFYLTDCKLCENITAPTSTL